MRVLLCAGIATDGVRLEARSASHSTSSIARTAGEELAMPILLLLDSSYAVLGLMLCLPGSMIE